MSPKKEKQANQPYRTSHAFPLVDIVQMHREPQAQDLFRCSAQDTRALG